jgi:hypothetical protein
MAKERSDPQMSPQADFIVSNGTGAAVRSDLNVQFAAIVSNSSGATEPATMYAYQWWADTTTGLLLSSEMLLTMLG